LELMAAEADATASVQEPSQVVAAEAVLGRTPPPLLAQPVQVELIFLLAGVEGGDLSGIVSALAGLLEPVEDLAAAL
jgi:hypothetical protein